MTDPWNPLEQALGELGRISDVKAAAVVRRDGLVVVHTLSQGTDPNMVAAMLAAIVGAAEMATEALDQGHFQRAIIESDEGKILSTGAGEEVLLVALVYSHANLGLILMAMERVARRIDEILSAEAIP